MSNEPGSWLGLRSPQLSAEIDPLGAQLSVLRDSAGQDLLWNGDPRVWSGRAPILFPIVGSLAGGSYRLGERSYPLPRHGFARGRCFEVVEATASSALFRLRDDEATRAVYPFPFELDVAYSLDGPALSVVATVRNTGPGVLPASLGFHPGFRWPLLSGKPRAAHAIEFDCEEPAPVRRIDADGLLTPTPHPSPVVGRRLALDDALFRDDVVIFEGLHSRSLIYGAAQGPRITVGFPDASHLGLWTKPGAGFLCIEPWQGVTDPVGYGGNFPAKPGVFVVSPGASRSLRMILSFHYSRAAVST